MTDNDIFSRMEWIGLPRLPTLKQAADVAEKLGQRAADNIHIYENGQPIKVPLPDVRQGTGYTCGPSALEAASKGMGGAKETEQQIAQEAGTTEEGGTTPEQLVAEAGRLGLRATIEEPMELNHLKEHLDHDRPVIVAIQAWPWKPGALTEGHYVVAIGYDTDNLYFEDPSIEGAVGYIPYDEFAARWVDEDAPGKLRRKLGIVLEKPGFTATDQPVGNIEKIASDTIEEKWSTDLLHIIKPDRPYAQELHLMAMRITELARMRSRQRRKRASKEKHAAIGPGMGIPNRRDMGDLSQLRAGELYDLIGQLHEAQRAGTHTDWRIGNPQTGLFSWATKKELPRPGGRIAMYRQPLHAHAYGSFQGTLGGYGAGTVRRKRRGQILITNASPEKIEFSTADERHPQRFALIKPNSWADKNWLLVNTTPSEAPPYEKLHFAKIPADQVEQHLEQMQAGDSVQAKIDGASSLIKLLKDGVEVLSYRSSTAGQPIVHTERMFHGRPKFQVPPEFVGTVLRGELYGQRERGTPDQAGTIPGTAGLPGDGGREDQAREQSGFGTATVTGPQELGGLLNASIARSLETQRERNLRLRAALFDIQQLGKTPVDFKTVPYAERRRMLEKVLPYLPQEYFELTPEARTKEEAKQLWEQIRSGQHPMTREGLVVHPSVGRPYKAKLLEDQDVHIRGVFPGAGKYKDVGAGGFEYALQPGGPVVGRVGTGLSDDLRRDLWSAPDAYIGRTARVRSQGAFPSGALRAPALIALHEDISKQADDDQWPKAAEDQEESVPTVAVDLDSTLAKPYEIFDPKVIPPPRSGARKWMRKLKALGIRIIIFTVRGDNELTARWLKRHKIPFDHINENPDQPEGGSGKVIADVYLDDRAVNAEAPLSKCVPEVIERLKLSNDQLLICASWPELFTAIELWREYM